MLLEPLKRQAKERPDAVAIVDDRGQTTWAELDQKARRLAKVIRSRTKKENVGILLPSGAAFVTAFYATLYAGKVVVPINFLLGEKETLHVVKDSGIDLVLTVDLMLKKLDAGKAVEKSGVNVLDLLALKPDLKMILAQLWPLPSSGRRDDELAALLYTSGTSGLPKGVELTHGNLQGDAEACIEHVGFNRPDNPTGRAGHDHTFLGIVPLFHSTGLLATMVAPVALGAKMVYIARFSPVATLKALREHDASVLMGVPSMYNALARLKDVKPGDGAGLFLALSGGEPLPGRVRDHFKETFGVEMMEGYGLTETCGPVCVNHPKAHRVGSVGRIVPMTSVKIMAEDGSEQPAGGTGEITIKGPMIFRAYLHLPEQTREAKTSDGFFKTGDLGHLDADGYLFVTGRAKDMMIVGGENVYPREIEELIARMPGVAEAAVIGRPDESRGEVPVAFLIVEENVEVTADAVKAYCRENGLPNFKIPKDVTIADDLPRSPTGKVLKRELRERPAAPAAPAGA